MYYYIILIFIVIIACASITNSFYQQAKYLRVDQKKWVLRGLLSFIFISIPLWCILKFFIDYFLIKNNYNAISSIITFLVIAYYVKDFFYSQMEQDIKMPMEDEELLDDIEF